MTPFQPAPPPDPLNQKCPECSGAGFKMEQKCCGKFTPHGECRGDCSIMDQVVCDVCGGCGVIQCHHPPDPLPGFTVADAQAVLDESVARRHHIDTFAEYARNLTTEKTVLGFNTWPQKDAITPADTSSPTNGTTLTEPATTKPASTKRREG